MSLSMLKIKVACMVNIKLLLMDWFYYDLIILIKWYKISYENLDKALLFSTSQVFCLKNWKLWGAQTTIEFNVFCSNFVRFLLTIVYKCFDLKLFAKIQKTWFLQVCFFTFLLITQDVNKIKKSRTPFCRHW